jgi:hypothetical protein
MTRQCASIDHGREAAPRPRADRLKGAEEAFGRDVLQLAHAFAVAASGSTIRKAKPLCAIALWNRPCAAGIAIRVLTFALGANADAPPSTTPVRSDACRKRRRSIARPHDMAAMLPERGE